MVPNDWKVLSLSEVTKEKISYGIVQAGPHVENGMPYIKSSNVGGKIKIEDLQKTSLEIHHKYRRSAVHPNDIIFSLRGNIGRTSIVPPELREANLTQGTARISVNEENETSFIYYSIASTPILNRIHTLSKGSTFKEISLEELRKIQLPVPPLPEQQKIAKILSTWDKAISATERLIDNSTQQKKALMQQLLTGKKRLLDDAGKRFEGKWKSQIIENITTRVGDGIHSTPKYTENSSIRFVNGNNLNNGSIDFYDSTKYVDEDDAKKHRRDLSNRTILMSINGTIGNLAIYNGENIVLGKSACYINVKNEVDLLFIFYKLASFELQSYFISRLTGSTIKNLSLTTIKSTQVELPSLEEQQKIATVLTNADQEIDLLKQQLVDLQQEKKALMQVLLTGKKRVVGCDTNDNEG